MSPERVLAKQNETGKYILIAGSVSKDLGNGDRIVWIYEKYPAIDFDPSDMSKIEMGLFNMKTMRNSRDVDVYRIILQDDEGKLERYSLISGDRGLEASDIRTLAICQKLAVESYCRKNNYDIIQRF